MAKLIKPVITTGSGITQKAAGGFGPTAGQSQPAQAPNGSASITPAELLTLLQSDLFDLKSHGLTVALTHNTGRLYIGLEFLGHDLDTVNGEIRLDGEPVKPQARKGDK